MYIVNKFVGPETGFPTILNPSCIHKRPNYFFPSSGPLAVGLQLGIVSLAYSLSRLGRLAGTVSREKVDDGKAIEIDEPCSLDTE